MENLIVSLNAVGPLFVLMLLGFLLRKIGLFPVELVPKINKLVFKVFLPCMFFNNIYTSDLSSAFNGKLVIYGVVTVLAVCLLACLIVPFYTKDNRRRGALIQSIFRSNYVILGIPVITILFGSEKAASASLLAAFITPCFNALSVIVLEVFRGTRPSVSKIVKSTVTNPLILAAVLAAAIKLLSIELPYVLSYSISSLGSVTTPISLLALGAFFRFDSLRRDLRHIAFSTVSRLAVVPLLATLPAVFFGFRNEEFAAILIAFSAPVAIASFPMAQQMDSDSELAGELVIVQSALSCFTLFLWIFLYKQLGIM